MCKNGLCSKIVRYLNQQLSKPLGPYSSALAALGTLQSRPLRLLKLVDPLVSNRGGVGWGGVVVKG